MKNGTRRTSWESGNRQEGAAVEKGKKSAVENAKRAIQKKEFISRDCTVA